MTDRPTFHYPRSGPLIARLLQFLGHGPKSWPAPRRLSASTLKRIAADEPTAQSIDEFLDIALGLLSPPGQWKLGQFGEIDRGEGIARLRAALRDYDRAVSEINADADLGAADPRHALPILALVAVRVGALFGVFASARERPLEELWPTTLDPDAFCRAVTDYAERAMPGTPWRDRGDECGVGRTTLDRWRKRRPGPDFHCHSLKNFARWAAERIEGEDQATIEWRLRWLVAGARIHAALERFLGRDAAGVAWVDRLYRMIQIHAGLNAAAFAGMQGVDTVIAALDPCVLRDLPGDGVLGLRRMFAYIAGRAKHFDPAAGPDLSLEELERLRVAMIEKEDIRRHVWTFLGGLHAIGLWTPGFVEDLARRGVEVEQYTVHLKEPAQYLRLQHFLVDSALAGVDADTVLAIHLQMPLTGADMAVVQRAQHELFADPQQLSGQLAVAQRLQALQRQYAGLPRVELPPLDPDVVPAEMRSFAGMLDMKRMLPVIAAEQGAAEAVAMLERMMVDHPELIEPAFVLAERASDACLEHEVDFHKLAAESNIVVDSLDRTSGGDGFRIYRAVLPLRRRVRVAQAQLRAIGDRIAEMLAALAARAGDDWNVMLAREVFLARRAAIDLKFRELRRPGTGDRAPLCAAIEALTGLHSARPDHPEPCLWLARMYSLLDDRPRALRWARLAEQRGEPGGLAALASLDERVAHARTEARQSPNL